MRANNAAKPGPAVETATPPWVDRYGMAFVAMLIAVAVLRIVMVRDFLASNPTAGSVGGDAGVYWDMAGRIAAGELVGDEPFLSVPLYPYALAVIRTWGGGLTAVYVAQVILHLATGVVIATLAARKFDRGTAALAMALFFLAEEPAFLMNRVLPSTVQLLVISMALLAAQQSWERGAIRGAIMTGIATGFLALIYPPAMILIPILAVWVWRRAARESKSAPGIRKTGRRRGVAGGAAAVLAACAVIAPATWHNWAACGEFIPITANAGITFAQGNAPGADGVYTRVEGVSDFRRTMHRDTAREYAAETGETGTYGAIDRFFLARGVDYLAQDPLRALGLTARKVYWFFTGRHYGDIYFPTLEQEDGWVHTLPLAPMPTAWLFGLAAVGLWFGWRSGRFHAFDLALFLLPLFVVATFWYSPRYRLAVIPIACLAGAWALVVAARSLGTRPRKWAAAATVGGLLAVSIATGAVNVAAGFDRPSRYRPQHEFNRGQDFARQGAYEAALVHLRRAEELTPERAAVVAAIAGALLELGRLDEAEREARRLADLDPASITAPLLIGSIHLRSGDGAGAEEAFARALSMDDRDPEAQLGMWFALALRNRREEGLAHLVAAIELDRTNAAALGEYGIWLAEQGEAAQAEAYLRESVRFGPDRPQTHLNLGELLADLGRLDEAAASFQRALALDPDYERARRRLATLQSTPSQVTPLVADLDGLIEDDPTNAAHYSRLAAARYAEGNVAEAVSVLRRGVVQADDRTTVALELAWLLSTVPDDTVRNGEEAVRLARGIVGSTENAPPEVLDVLAAALAETGQYEKAVEHAARAATLADNASRDDLARRIRARLEVYRSGRPYRQP